MIPERDSKGKFLPFKHKFISTEEKAKMENLKNEWLKNNKVKKYNTRGELINGTN